MGVKKKHNKPHKPSRIIALLLCLCMITSIISGIELFTATAYAAENVDSGYTEHVLNRVADGDTTDTYQGKLLNQKDSNNGSRYAGRVWTDKSVFAYDTNEAENALQLDMATDGYEGKVKFDADFAHVFSALASSQVVNEWPPSPIDLVIVFDMSGSMGQDTRYGIDTGGNAYQAHTTGGDDSTTNPWPEQGVPMADRIKYSRVQKTLDAINKTIDKLMEQNPQNRVAVCGYGANATVLMPLAHYKHDDKNTPYLSVGGMETLYHPSDLVYKTTTEDSVKQDGWYWMNNRDTCYTVVVNSGNQSNTYTGPLSDNTKDHPENQWTVVKKHTVSNNALDNKGNPVKAFPGAWDEDGTTPLDTYKTESQTVYNNASSGGYKATSTELTNAMKDTTGLKADDYVGYFTNTQGGIYLAYKQLADTSATTYSEKLTNGQLSTVARIPAAIIMSDGGANFAFNEMGQEGQSYTAGDWNARYSEERKDASDDNNYYVDDNNWHDAILSWDNSCVDGHNLDYKHRLGITGEHPTGNLGDEWYNVFLPGKDTLGPDWNGLHGIYNVGADKYQDGTLSTQPYWNHAGVFYSSDRELGSTSGAVLEVLLTASYMNDVVKEHYDHGWTANNATKESQVQLSTFTMNVDTAHVPQWGRWRLFPTLDPKGHPLDSITEQTGNGWNTNLKELGIEYNNEDAGWGAGDIYVNTYGAFTNLQKTWNSWKDGKNDTTAAMGADGTERGTIDVLPEGGHTYQAGGGDTVTVYNNDVIENIAYNREFFDVNSEELDNTFEKILSEITGQVFIPVSGDNDAGVGNSVTYQDPIGEYMDIKHQSITVTPYHKDSHTPQTETTYDMAMVLFGEMHGLTRTGVYDYQWNDKYMQKNNPDNAGTNPMKVGWYKGDDPEGKVDYVKSGELPDGCETAEEAWNSGWVMRLSFQELFAYVPIAGVQVPEDGNLTPANVPENIKHTVYTLYRFSCEQEDRNKLRINPIYGDTVPEDIQQKWNDYYVENDGKYPDNNGIYANTPGVYRLSDIRVWLEDYGDYKDSEGAGAITPNPDAYDASLYVNVPATAVPTQLAEITLGKNGVMSYETNLGEDHPIDSQIIGENGEPITVTKDIYENYCAQSTPIRLFYAVGLTEDLIIRDAYNKQVAVNISKISEEYVKKHTGEKGNIWFISNYYSNTLYNGYDNSSEGRTRGDPTVTFSPSNDNRYYVFQKPLPLYAHAYRVKDGELTPVDRSDDGAWETGGGGNGGTYWEGTTEENPINGSNWSGGEFMGVYASAESFKAALGEKDEKGMITDANGAKYPVVDNGIVFFQNDLLDDVTENGKNAKSFASDDYFFLLVEYYLPDLEQTGKDRDGKDLEGSHAGREVQYCVSRRGSMFGSGFQSDKITNGDLVCWTDMNGKASEVMKYNSYSGTGDTTRGKPTYEKLCQYKTEKDLKNYLKETCGLRETKNGDETQSPLDAEVTYWLAMQDKLKDALSGITDKTEFDKKFHFAVAAKPGGLRAGNMSNNVQMKEAIKGNKTATSNSYYLPTVSNNSGIGDNTVINNYLGNNGRLEVNNRELVVTKQLVPPDGFELSEEQQKKIFNYQVYIENATGEREAIQVQYNQYAKVWQRQMDVVDVLTDNSGLLLDSNSNRVLFYCGKQNGTDINEKPAYEGKLVVPKTVNGTIEYYYAEEDGTKTEQKYEGNIGELYYVYLPNNESGESGDTFTRRIYQYGKTLQNSGCTTYVPDDVTETSMDADTHEALRRTTDPENRPVGTRSYWVTDAEMIPVSEVLAAEQLAGDEEMTEPVIMPLALEAMDGGVTRWEHKTSETHRHMSYLTILVRKPPDSNTLTGKDQIISPYSTKTQYLTKKLTFGINANKNDKGTKEPGETLTADDLYDSNIPDEWGDVTPDKIAQNTAEFSLQKDEGLLFTGLNGGKYRFTEELTAGDLGEGYTLKQVEQITGKSTDTPEAVTGGVEVQVDEESESKTTTYYPKYFTEPEGVYSVDGSVTTFEDRVHYTNTVSKERLIINKKMDGSSSEQAFDFTVQLKHPAGKVEGAEAVPYTEELHYWKGLTKDITSTDPLKVEGEEIVSGGAPALDDTVNIAQLPTLKPTDYSFKLKADESIVIYGLDFGTEYTVTETKNEQYPIEGGDTGYTRTGKIVDRGTNELKPEPQPESPPPNEETFVNVNKATGSLEVEKQIENDEPDTDVEFTFEVELKAGEGTEKLDSKALTVKWMQKDGDNWTEKSPQPENIEWKPSADGTLTGTFKLHDDEKIVIDGIPLGTTYTVTETDTKGYNLQRVEDGTKDAADKNMNLEGQSVTGTITAAAPPATSATVYLRYVNARPVNLPFAGGMGWIPKFILAIGLLTAAAILTVRRRIKQQQRRKN